MTSLSVTCSWCARPHNFHDPFPCVAYQLHVCIALATTLFVSSCSPGSTNTMAKLSLTDNYNILWHFPSEGPLSYPFTSYKHTTSYRPMQQGALPCTSVSF